MIGQCSDEEENMKFPTSTADTEYQNVTRYQCRLLCIRTRDCVAWTRSGRSQCFNIKAEAKKQEETDWSLGMKYCGGKNYCLLLWSRIFF